MLRKSGVARPDPGVAKELLQQNAPPQPAESPVKPTPTAPDSLPTTSTPLRNASAQSVLQPEVSAIQPLNLSNRTGACSQAPGPAPAPSQIVDPMQLLKSLGNSNKAKALRREMAKSGQLRKGQQKIVFDAAHEVPSTASELESAAPSESVTLSITSRHFGTTQSTSGITRRLPPPPPSTRSDLPSNVTVTSVDVERDDWVPGEQTKDFVAPVQVPHYARFGAPASADAISATLNGKGNHSQSAKKGKARAAAPAAEASAAAEIASNKPGRIGWTGWPSAEAVETGFDGWRKVIAPDEGEKVAVKVSTQYELQISLADSTFRCWSFRLHPTCLPFQRITEWYWRLNPHQTGRAASDSSSIPIARSRQRTTKESKTFTRQAGKPRVDCVDLVVSERMLWTRSQEATTGPRRRSSWTTSLIAVAFISCSQSQS